MVSGYVAIVWPELANAGPIMLRYGVLICCDRLAGACKCWANNVAICCVDKCCDRVAGALESEI